MIIMGPGQYDYDGFMIIVQPYSDALKAASDLLQRTTERGHEEISEIFTVLG